MLVFDSVKLIQINLHKSLVCNELLDDKLISHQFVSFEYPRQRRRQRPLGEVTFCQKAEGNGRRNAVLIAEICQPI